MQCALMARPRATSWSAILLSFTEGDEKARYNRGHDRLHIFAKAATLRKSPNQVAAAMKMRQTRQPKEPRKITLRLDAMTYGGDAIGTRLCAPGGAGGKVIFVRGGIAGEWVRAEIVEERDHFARAQVTEVIEPSPERVRPRCPHFGFSASSCGGCTWQHIDYAAQLRFKTEIVREQLRRIGKIADAPVHDALPSPDVWAYRNHAQFSVTQDGQLGLQAARSNRVTPIKVCHIVQPPIADFLSRQSVADASRRVGLARVDVRSSSSQLAVALEQDGRFAQSDTQLEFTVKGVPFRVSAESFFQVNTSLVETLVDLVLDRLDLRGGETVLDAYCGVGLFSRFVAPVAGRVIGIESSHSAVDDARENLAPFDHVDLVEGRVEQTLASLDAPMDAAILDPPRAGCGRHVIGAVTDKQIKRLVYVSCDPATLARDARQLVDRDYRLIDVQPIDMFPHTFHIETVTLWIWNGG
jgi:23S rRNA (uracil1939-C5)-methyltransferase